jgi:hypothetical protein
MWLSRTYDEGKRRPRKAVEKGQFAGTGGTSCGKARKLVYVYLQLLGTLGTVLVRADSPVSVVAPKRCSG